MEGGHIRINLGLEKLHPAKRARFEKECERGHAKWCERLQLAIAGDALSGKVTVQKVAAQGWLGDRYGDVETSAWSRRIPDGGEALKQRVLALIKKHKQARRAKRELAKAK